MSELFDNACLIQLKTSCWTGTKQLTDAAMSQMGNDPHWLNSPMKNSLLCYHRKSAIAATFHSR